MMTGFSGSGEFFDPVQNIALYMVFIPTPFLPSEHTVNVLH
jgi:hypothetical protein